MQKWGVGMCVWGGHERRVTNINERGVLTHLTWLLEITSEMLPNLSQLTAIDTNRLSELPDDLLKEVLTKAARFDVDALSWFGKSRVLMRIQYGDALKGMEIFGMSAAAYPLPSGDAFLHQYDRKAKEAIRRLRIIAQDLETTLERDIRKSTGVSDMRKKWPLKISVRWARAPNNYGPWVVVKGDTLEVEVSTTKPFPDQRLGNATAEALRTGLFRDALSAFFPRKGAPTEGSRIKRIHAAPWDDGDDWYQFQLKLRFLAAAPMTLKQDLYQELLRDRQ